MDRILEQLLADAQSQSPDIQQEAITKLGLLLEKHSTNPDSLENYRVLLPDYILDTKLGLHEQELLVQKLCDLANSQEVPAHTFWALSKVRREIGFRPFLDVFNQRKDQLDEASIWQMLIALDNFLLRSGSKYDLQEQNQMIEQNDIVSWLNYVVTTENSRFQKQGQSILKKIRESQSLRYIE